MSTQARFPWQQRTNDGQDEDLISDNAQNSDTDAPREQSSSECDRPEPNKPVVYTSQWATLFIIVNVTIGVGLLAMPYAMQMAGIVTSMIVQLIFLSLIVITCIMCIEMTVKTDGVDSYHRLVFSHCHPYVYQGTQVSILLIVFGATVAYIVTVGDQADRLFASLYGPTFCNTWYMNRRFIMSALTLLAMKPLCSARTVDFLKYGSFLGVVSIGFIFYVVLSEFLKSTRTAPDVNYYPRSWIEISSILPVFCLGYQCHLSLVPTVATIHKRKKPKAFVTASIAMIISMIIYSSISILAVLTFGSAIESDLTESYPGKDWPILVTIGVVGVKCILTLPAAYLPARLSLIDILTNNFARFAQLSEPIRRIGVTVLFLDSALMMALYVPNILVAVNILGCFAVMFIFNLPGLAYLNFVKQNRLDKQRAEGLDDQTPIYTAKDKMKRVTSFFMIIFGTLMTVVVLYKSIEEMLHSTSSPPLCHN